MNPTTAPQSYHCSLHHGGWTLCVLLPVPVIITVTQTVAVAVTITISTGITAS